MSKTIVNTTRSYCCDCQALHEATVESEQGRIFFNVHCPLEEKRCQISSDADIFLKMREKKAGYNARDCGTNEYTWLNILEITKDCNFSCPVCFAAAETNTSDHLPVERVLALVNGLKKKKLRAVTLSGGEPTLHPDLFTIIRNIKRMQVTLLTNGFLCGENPDMTRLMKKSGLSFCYFQFDTLDPDVHRKLRGNDCIDIKKKALENANRAGLKFGITTTFIKDNLKEAGDLLAFSAGYAPRLSVITYLAAAKTGRFLLPDDLCVDRESIIRSIIDSGVVDGLTVDHFHPFPKFRPIGLGVHSDCASLLYLALRNGAYEPLDNYFDVDKFHRLMSRTRGKVNLIWGFILFNLYFARSITFKKIIPLYRMIFGLLTGYGKHSIMTVAVEQFLGETYQDQERIDGCTNRIIMTDGTMVPACVYQHPDPRRHLHIRPTG